jgi:pterin-4a-carbinolamine dehydratase
MSLGAQYGVTGIRAVQAGRARRSTPCPDMSGFADLRVGQRVVSASCHSGQMASGTMTRAAASAAVEQLGWRYLLRSLATSVAVPSLEDALRVSSSAVTASGADADAHLRIDVRADRVELSLQTASVAAITDIDLELARRISTAVAGLGFATAEGGVVPADGRAAHPTQSDPPRHHRAARRGRGAGPGGARCRWDVGQR